MKPAYSEAWTSLASSHESLGRYDEAVSAYRETVRLNPGRHLDWSAPGRILLDHGNYAEAGESFKKAIEGAQSSEDQDRFTLIAFYYGQLVNICDKTSQKEFSLAVWLGK